MLGVQALAVSGFRCRLALGDVVLLAVVAIGGPEPVPAAGVGLEGYL